MANVITVTKETLEEEVMKTDRPVLLDFSATWCGPCQMIAPILEEIAADGAVKVCKVDVDEQRELAKEFGIDAIPTLFAVKDGKVVKATQGYQPKEALMKLFD